MKPQLGCCYYPEHWPAERWETDAKMMYQAGLRWVRIGEFAWSRIEPLPGQYNWEWLDQAVETLSSQGLRIVMGTPTATPPRWMINRYPDMLAVDENGNKRGFGSRRHYCFSHEGYKSSAVRIVEQLGERYGNHSAIGAWQTDNEYGCHNTVRSYSPSALTAFRTWLVKKYSSIEALNSAWGTVFWSIEYTDFADIELPNLTVTEPLPAHVLDFKRFSSEQVANFNRAQTDVLRKYTDAPILHNYMGRVVEFDHFDVGRNLDIATWDAYPLGFIEDRSDYGDDWRERFARQGDPDFQAFHHDLYRAVGRGRWWVMEQQPGPVNWAPFNPAPLDGMVRLWSWEAFAHGAEVVNYFRWRQLPFGQEQHHAGLLTTDARPAQGLKEATQTGQEIEQYGNLTFQRAEVALVFDYESAWAWETQPQGENFDYFKLIFDFYRQLRRLGLNIDIVAPDELPDKPYKLMVVPGLMTLDHARINRFRERAEHLLIGPRSGSRTDNFHIDPEQPQGFDSMKPLRVESLRPNLHVQTARGEISTWFEHFETQASNVWLATTEGHPAVIREQSSTYLCGWPSDKLLKSILVDTMNELCIDYLDLPEGLRVRETQEYRFWFNYDSKPCTYLDKTIGPADVRIEPRV